MRVKINSARWGVYKLPKHYPMLDEFNYEFNENAFESTIELELLADLKGLIKLLDAPIICWDDEGVFFNHDL